MAKGKTHDFELIEEAYGFSSYVHRKNGLKLLIAEKRELPVIGTMVTYHVGSRHELPGHTGATHILEHLMFKGSKKYDPKKGNGIWSLLEKKGSQGNATTWCDRTNYYWISPASLKEDALHIEADRMRNALLRAEDLASEMKVVRNEYESGENDPMQRLGKQAWYQAFSVHPYRIPTIGTKEDIEGITVEKLKKFYDAFYWPNNATLTIVGDTDTESALQVSEEAFGSLPKAEIVEPPFHIEPPQKGERRFELKRQGAVNALMMCFKAPAGLAEDAYALSALSAVLSKGKSSLLYRALIDTGLATELHADFPRFKDPSLFEIYVALSENVPHEKVEQVIFETIESISTGGLKEADLERAVNFKIADRLYSLSSVAGMLSAMNESIARGDWKDTYSFQHNLQQVALADVAEAARKYLGKDLVTIGYLKAI
jgi:zinc protease